MDPSGGACWASGCNVLSLEKTADSVREKYTGLLGKVLDRVRDEHGELDSPDVRCYSKGTRIGVGKASWASKKGHSISGLSDLGHRRRRI